MDALAIQAAEAAVHPGFPPADTVLIVERKVSDTVHTFVCDASWGTDLYGVAAGGVARRELKHDTSAGDWWDVHPLTGVDAHRNRVGPYNEHRIHGMFRPNDKP